MFILDGYADPWNYTFIVIALISIGIGTFLALRNMKKSTSLKSRRERRNQDK